MGAEVEHIEIVGFQQARIVGDLVHDDGYGGAAAEYRQRLQNGFMRDLDMTARQQVDAHGEHGAVADHGLDIDADGGDEHVPGVEHDAQAGEHGPF